MVCVSQRPEIVRMDKQTRTRVGETTGDTVAPEGARGEKPHASVSCLCRQGSSSQLTAHSLTDLSLGEWTRVRS